ncbi:fatty acid desaturase-like protein 1 [Elsinoe australis]|uniref:Fatty acid desaturase-like protein 1 n=1 Tax=Elsinoe australis TaxID=40998 RepID=A0A4U7B4L7_9PEZI|nr:fatty acid desaturase-like protein 1 [Elsinoe australis]
MSTTVVTTTEVAQPTIRVKGVESKVQPRPTQIAAAGRAWSLKEIRDAIPNDCFESSLPTSLAYLARDIAYCAALVYLALQIQYLPNAYVRFAAWAVYGFVQGCVGTGIWILAHECGHGAFSRYPRVNDFIGWVCHSFLLVPYFSWQITHARHHRNTGHIEKDPVFTPTKESDLPDTHDHHAHDLFEDAPIKTTFDFIIHQLIGWQLYLSLNVTAGSRSGRLDAPNNPKGSHFNPLGDLWNKDQRRLILYSDIGLLLTLSGLYLASRVISPWTVLALYLPPYLWVHNWLVAITYLHHTDPSVPYYDDQSWSFTKGALSTVDRDFGFIGRHFMHDIIDHHVVHHLFTKIPFYNAQRATEAIRPVLGERYKSRKDVNFVGDLVQTFGKCEFVRRDGEGRWNWATKEEMKRE